MRTNAALHDQDFYAWTQQQAALLRDQKTQALDCANLAEEIESLGRSDKRELGNRLQILVMHLLKWHAQPEGHAESHSWADTIWDQRPQIALLLEDSPSLHGEIPARLARHYPLARRHVARETRLPLATFPVTCPWTVEQILAEDFWPEATPEEALSLARPVESNERLDITQARIETLMARMLPTGENGREA